jgi:hypothetical protein
MRGAYRASILCTRGFLILGWVYLLCLATFRAADRNRCSERVWIWRRGDYLKSEVLNSGTIPAKNVRIMPQRGSLAAALGADATAEKKQRWLACFDVVILRVVTVGPAHRLAYRPSSAKSPSG